MVRVEFMGRLAAGDYSRRDEGGAKTSGEAQCYHVNEQQNDLPVHV